MTKFRHTFADDVQESFKANGAGGWRPAIAYPFFVGYGLRKAKCGCGRTFKKLEDYEAHYVYMAVWQNESGYIPKILAGAQKAGGLLNELKHAEATKQGNGLPTERPDTNTGSLRGAKSSLPQSEVSGNNKGKNL
jgi:hypothetical protein